MANKRTIAVTGASGFVGRYVVRELVSRGYAVRALVRDMNKARAVLPATGAGGAVQLVRGDVLDAGIVAELLRGCGTSGACINLIGIIREKRGVAAGESVTFRKAHVESTRALVAGCGESGTRRFLQMSALGVTPNGVCEYQTSKFEAEQIVRMSELDWTIFRPGLIHGPDGDFMQMMKHILEGSAPPYLFAPYFTRGIEDKSVPLGAVQQRDPLVQPVAVEDVAAAFATALESPASIGEVYNLVGSEAMDWPTMLRFMGASLGAGNVAPFGVPAEAAANAATAAGKLGFGSLLPFDAGMARMGAMDTTANSTKVREDLGLDLKPFRSTFGAYASRM
ncbi:MAG: NAD(P)H-binding protein [Planctomycetes bacterium]|nr:NAD(P)H-binding protein [Planctomycetota bacterium]